jgi:Tryptophan-associated transmembrane protein (Trp_oprn_chp)
MTRRGRTPAGARPDGVRRRTPAGAASQAARRRALAIAVASCALGAVLALLAATRTWTVVVSQRQAPPAVLRTPRTGSVLEPWLTALALVALAGAGALLATKGRSRAAVGAVLVLSGLGVLIGGVRGLAAVPHVTVVWPVLAVAGALLIGYGGGLATLHGRAWPAMGSRYERPAAPRTPAEDQPQFIGPSASDVAMWDALDRGEDPTRRGD